MRRILTLLVVLLAAGCTPTAKPDPAPTHAAVDDVVLESCTLLPELLPARHPMAVMSVRNGFGRDGVYLIIVGFGPRAEQQHTSKAVAAGESAEVTLVGLYELAAVEPDCSLMVTFEPVT